MSIPVLTPQKIIKRSPENPILSAKDIPFESSLIFNAGVTKFQGKYIMVFRDDYGYSAEDFADWYPGSGKRPPHLKTKLGFATSYNGINWEVKPDPFFDMKIPGAENIYDPRLTVIDGRCYMCFAVHTRWGQRGGIAVTDDFNNFEILHITVPDNRNLVLFPEKIKGDFVRLERPFPVYGREEDEAFDMWMSTSPDGKFWGENKLLLGTEDVPFCNCKIGPGAPPVKTSKGWLTTFHAVEKVNRELCSWHKGWDKVYYGGIMLLDLEAPSKIIGMCKQPILTPVADYETKGFRGEVIFPGGMVLEDSGEVKIYYGAADTVECLATAHVDDLIKLCLENRLVN